VTKNQQKACVLLGLENAMKPAISLLTCKGLCDVTNKSKPNDQLGSSKMGNLIHIFYLKARCVFIICSAECPDGKRRNVMDSTAVEVDRPFPVLGKTLVEEVSKSHIFNLQRSS
jgi:hypothetical protein